MKKTDVIIPINPLVKKDSLQLIVVNTKRGVQVIPIESSHPRYVIVEVDEGERVKLNIDEKQTVKIDPTAIHTPRSIFTYYIYNICTEKEIEVIEPDCDYFFSTCKTLKIKQAKTTKVNNKVVGSNNKQLKESVKVN